MLLSLFPTHLVPYQGIGKEGGLQDDRYVHEVAEVNHEVGHLLFLVLQVPVCT